MFISFGFFRDSKPPPSPITNLDESRHSFRMLTSGVRTMRTKSITGFASGDSATKASYLLSSLQHKVWLVTKYSHVYLWPQQDSAAAHSEPPMSGLQTLSKSARRVLDRMHCGQLSNPTRVVMVSSPAWTHDQIQGALCWEMLPDVVAESRRSRDTCETV